MVYEDPIDLEVWELRVAVVAQNERLVAIAYENIGVMWNIRFVHRLTHGRSVCRHNARQRRSSR